MQVFAWGNNSLGQLGLNDTSNRRAPAPVEALWAIPVAQLAAGEAHSAALTINGFLFTWGHNEKGQLGLAAGADAVAQVGAYRNRVFNDFCHLGILLMWLPVQKLVSCMASGFHVGTRITHQSHIMTKITTPSSEGRIRRQWII